MANIAAAAAACLVDEREVELHQDLLDVEAEEGLGTVLRHHTTRQLDNFLKQMNPTLRNGCGTGSASFRGSGSPDFITMSFILLTLLIIFVWLNAVFRNCIVSLLLSLIKDLTLPTLPTSTIRNKEKKFPSEKDDLNMNQLSPKHFHLLPNKKTFQSKFTTVRYRYRTSYVRYGTEFTQLKNVRCRTT